MRSLFAACLLYIAAYAQAPNLDPRHPHDKILPTVSFELVIPGENSPNYVLSVDAAGNAAYRSQQPVPNAAADVPFGQPYIVKFIVAQPTCARIFELARQANYFERSSAPGVATLDPTFARTSTRFNTLTYSYGPLYSFDLAFKSVRTSVTYNRTGNSAIQELTSIFESISRDVQSNAIIGEPVNVVP